ncbi:MAG: hypothetical protein Q7V01_10980, partial [Vicinamibacterales bacterium]|nr:hypothetical protein [Vicinamibacterales bacterium]
ETGRDPVADVDTIRRELELYLPEFAGRPQIAAANKMDVVTDTADVERLDAHLGALGIPVLRVSAATGAGLDALLEAMWTRISVTGDRVE